MLQNVHDITPLVTKILDRTVYSVSTRPDGAVITSVKAIVRADDDQTYTCYYQSTWLNGQKTMSDFTGFERLNDDATPSPDEDTQPVTIVEGRQNNE